MRNFFSAGLFFFGAATGIFWGIFLSNNGLNNPISSLLPGFIPHIIIELLTAAFCLYSSQLLLRNRPESPVTSSFGFGLLAYGGINNISIIPAGTNPAFFIPLIAESIFGVLGLLWLMLAVRFAVRKRKK